MDELVTEVKDSYKKAQWWKNREIRLFWESDIDNSTVAVIMDEIHNLCQTIGINLNLIPYGSNQNAMLQIQSVIINGQLDYNKLFTIYRRDKGDIFISSRHLLNDTVSLGRASYLYGCMVLCLYDNSQYYYNVIRRLARHQMTHLLGLPFHCDEFSVQGYDIYKWCNMHYKLHSLKTCPKCMAFMRYFWRYNRM